LLADHIKVTAIHPGMVETEFSKVRFKGDEERAAAVYDGIEPLLAEDIAEAAWLVASRPKHGNINDMLIMPSMEASGPLAIRETRFINYALISLLLSRILVFSQFPNSHQHEKNPS